ncbi:MAG: helix-turn-helix transcriptional regulator [bacterium]|nr:helix-turn-helix transcriptional regulator [bacterium]MXZ29611.1 helix-turn-helix transcriptional regulator [Acidimicrobiia bacterium]MDE0669989.1 helix-turn-helix transcriptional regulator [bacterium]MYB25828.1 helix-turn-helix transcriptional regulator [Acidimicrobiia bacterium]MYE67664.1 helix-turn-helix transcriptional regulator [Acidimicrobiia bacterium]
MIAHSVEVIASDLRTPPQISRALRARRRALGLSQAAVAEMSGVSPQWLSGFENGKGSCGTHRVLRLVEVLGLSVALHERPETDMDRVFAAVAAGDSAPAGRGERVRAADRPFANAESSAGSP